MTLYMFLWYVNTKDNYKKIFLAVILIIVYLLDIFTIKFQIVAHYYFAPIATLVKAVENPWL